MYNNDLENLIAIEPNFYYKHTFKVANLNKETYPGRRTYFRIERFLKRLCRQEILNYVATTDREQLRYSIYQYVIHLRRKQSQLIKGLSIRPIYRHWLEMGYIRDAIALNNFEIMLARLFRIKRATFSRPWGGWKYIKPIKNKQLASNTGNTRVVRKELRSWSGNNKAIAILKLVSVIHRPSMFSLSIDFFDQPKKRRQEYVEVLSRLGEEV